MIAPQYQYVSQFCLLVGSIYRQAFLLQWGRGHKSFKWMFSLINPGRTRICLSTVLKRTHSCTFTTVWQNAWQFILVEEGLFLFHNFRRFQSNTGEGTVWFRATEAIFVYPVDPETESCQEPGNGVYITFKDLILVTYNCQLTPPLKRLLKHHLRALKPWAGGRHLDQNLLHLQFTLWTYGPILSLVLLHWRRGCSLWSGVV